MRSPAQSENRARCAEQSVEQSKSGRQKPVEPGRCLGQEPSQRLRRQPRPCKHCAASARRKNCAISSSIFWSEHLNRIDSNSTQKIGKTGVRTQRTEFGIGCETDHCRGMLIECALEPAKSFVVFAKSCIHCGN